MIDHVRRNLILDLLDQMNETGEKIVNQLIEAVNNNELSETTANHHAWDVRGAQHFIHYCENELKGRRMQP